VNKILIIDEAGEQTRSTVTFLANSGYEVRVAENVFLAAAILRKRKFDLILCSQKLFIERKSPLQKIILEDTRHSKIILLQEPGENVPVSQQNSRIIGSIEKPVDLQKLLEVVSSKVHKSGFTGMVNDIDITDYLQLLAMNKKTKAFVVEGENGKGVMVLHMGKLIYAAFGELRGDLAFHTLLSQRGGKIIDKNLKRIPQPNINKSLTQLLLEATTNSDESRVVDSVPRNDFLVEDYQPEPEGISEPLFPEHVQQGQGKTMLFIGLAFLLLFGLVGGMAWKLSALMELKEKSITSQNQLEVTKPSPLVFATTQETSSAPPVIQSPQNSAKRIPPLPMKSNGTQDETKSTQTEPYASHTSIQAATLQVETEKEKTKEMATTASQPLPKILFRLHGSNTIGSKLAENLATDYLIHKLNGKDIVTLQGNNTEEKIIMGHTDQGPVGIEIHAHGSTTGFEDLKTGKCDIGMASRKIKDKEIVELASLGDMTAPSSEHILALDGIAVIVNKRNPLRSLNIETIAAIFSGKITDWKELSDGNFEGPINIYARDDKSGTYDTFKGIVLKKTPLISTAKRFESNAELSDDVSRDKLGIGFTGLPYIRQSKALSVSDQGTTPVYPNFFTVATEDYLLARRLYLYLPANSESPMAENFIDYSLTSSGQAVVDDTGFVDLNIRPFVANIDTDGLTIQNTLVFQHYLRETKDKKRLSLNFRFRKDSTELDNRALRDLDRMVEFLKKQPIESVSLIGFADSRGDYQYNTNLALERSKVVRDELKSRGIPLSAVISASEEMPVSSNITNIGREKNRRVEVWVQLDKA